MADSLHVLVVEDSLVAQTVAKLQLTKLGCTVELAVDGKDALERTNQTKFDLILMDIGLGEGPDGFEVTIQIKKDSIMNQTTPIIAVTAHGEPEFTEKALASGMERYFNKPFTPQAAQEIIDYVTKQSDMAKQS
ncbi:response regulator [Legionella brunensis]|uniref:Sensory histidine-kinase / response regulator n=1 Tax=Legionella brunensis TaxID=29422 RepID=A0A0W0SK46_9GAMM|nr:response regulator [Legionella brunensis]KTC83727.1 sensory histidine-kinase / response regulator [Legionella brunensis]